MVVAACLEEDVGTGSQDMAVTVAEMEMACRTEMFRALTPEGISTRETMDRRMTGVRRVTGPTAQGQCVTVRVRLVILTCLLGLSTSRVS